MTDFTIIMSLFGSILLLDENRTYLCEKSELEAEKFIKYLHTKSRISNKLTLNQIFGTCLDSVESHQVIICDFNF